MIRLQEYKVFFYRLFLAYAFYFIARILFYLYNDDLMQVESFSEAINICYRGLGFDTTAIIYVNALFILMSFLPLFVNTKPKFQKVLLWVYFVPNLIAYATNYVDFIYYKYTYTRLTTASLESIQHESNGSGLFFAFLKDYWHVFALYFIMAFLWVKLYKRVKVEESFVANKLRYALSSLVVLAVVAILAVGGIRGDFKHSTRPINMVDAGRHVDKVEHANMVLNTPFSIIRTLNKNYFKERKGVSQAEIEDTFKPIKQYDREVEKRPNVVVLIVESFSREFIGAFNKHLPIEGYKSYTPFVDSLATKSLIFPNTYANGRKSIHAMSSVLAGIPSFKVAYTSSPYSNRKITSAVSGLNDLGYDTSFFHGAPNGSMGFLGFGNILGFDHYYGKDEYNNDADFDGLWGIWDEPFLSYVSDELSKKQEPFMGTVITLSSHSPYEVPAQYKDTFTEGDIVMHKCIEYTDHALKKFFEKAKKEPWYENTVFIITADHCNLIHYDYYKLSVNRFAVPMLIFSPNEAFKGVDYSLAQQIDIYPTILDAAGYKKPFRSWGRSLLRQPEKEPFVITHTGSNYVFMKDDLICSFDDEKVLGVYEGKDLGLKQRVGDLKQKKAAKIKREAMGIVQDYMNRIVQNKLNAE